jgi:hypothetical protein
MHCHPHRGHCQQRFAGSCLRRGFCNGCLPIDVLHAMQLPLFSVKSSPLSLLQPCLCTTLFQCPITSWVLLHAITVVQTRPYVNRRCHLLLLLLQTLLWSLHATQATLLACKHEPSRSRASDIRCTTKVSTPQRQSLDPAKPRGLLTKLAAKHCSAAREPVTVRYKYVPAPIQQLFALLVHVRFYAGLLLWCAGTAGPGPSTPTQQLCALCLQYPQAAVQAADQPSHG